MKKLTVCLMTVLMLLTTIPIQLQAAPNAVPTSMTTTKDAGSAEAEVLIERLNEIKAMDKSNLNSPEKKQLRKEVRSIKSKLNAMGGGGVYISVGAIIIIVLLLIILF